eukprot:550993_1
MPSFSISKANYHEYYTRQVDSISIQKVNIFNGTHRKLRAFLIVTAVITMVQVVFGMSWTLIMDIFFYNHTRILNKYHLYYIPDFLYIGFNVIFSLILSLTLLSVHVQINFFHEVVKLNTHFIIMLIFLWFIISSCLCIPFYKRNEWISTGLFNNRSAICSYLFCAGNRFTIYYLYMFIITNNNGDAINNKLLEPQISIDHTSQSYNISTFKISSVIIKFWLALIGGNVIYYCFSNLHGKLLNSHFLVLFWIFWFFMFCFKRIIKRIFKDIDSIRAKYGYVFSGTYLFEFYFSCLYWEWVKTYISFDIPSSTEFIYISTFHFILEFGETNIKFSEIYFNVSRHFLSWLHNKSIEGGICMFFYKVLYKMFRDNSNMHEWRTRHSMDIIMRFYSSLLMSILVILYFVAIGKKEFIYLYKTDESKYQRA